MTLDVAGVWKAYPRYSHGPRTLRARLSRRGLGALRGGETRWALRDVSLSVAPGEAVGIVGHNGAGKSTLLRLAAGLGRPTRGRVATPPGTASVLSLGSWFDHELTGAENAETAAVVLGLRPRAARRSVPAALAFAELESFAEAPLRTYSDGMRLRLAFGVLAQLEPSLLIVDEALAVGDAAFQRTCLEWVAQRREQGTALVLASHDLDQVTAECERAIWLHRGEVRFAGPAGEAVEAYREAGRRETLARTPARLGQDRWGSQELRIENAVLLGPDGSPASEAPSGSTLTVELELHPTGVPVADPQVIVELKRASDDLLVLEASTAGGGPRLGALEAPVRLAVALERLQLAPGDYLVCAGVYPPDWEYAYDYRHALARVRLTGPRGKGVIAVPPRWRRI